jgi:hypothetical protein
MVSLILYELRSRWSNLTLLLGIFILWDIFLVLGLADLDVLAFTLLHLSSIGFLVILVGSNTFQFYTDFLNRHISFVSSTPCKKWLILVSKLIPFWTVSLVYYFVHSIFLVTTFILISERTNAKNSLLTFLSQLTKINIFLILMATLGLLFFYLAFLLIRMQIQQSKVMWLWVLTLLAFGSSLLLFTLQKLLVLSLSAQNILDWKVVSLQNPVSYLILAGLSILLFWITCALLKKHTDQ